jgi:predicted KAP-like P-loop ATPase
MTAETLFEDRGAFVLIPDYETEVDFLNCEAISKTVVQLLRDNRKRALTIGIHGDWGAGKSSILKMVQSDLSQDKDVAVLWFNGWAFQGFDDAKTVIIEATIAELIRQRSTTGKVREIGGKLLKRIDWLKIVKRGGGLAFNLATGLPSPDQIGSAIEGLNGVIEKLKGTKPEEIEEQLKEAASFLKPGEDANVPEVIHHFREEFSALLEAAKIDQLVVLIDDLDRCLPATAIETLEAIRLFLFVPKTAFVIGADEGMIEYAVRQHFPDLPLSTGPIPYARNYLEKLIQVPFRIPALGAQETRIYVLLLLIEGIVGSDHAGFNALLAKAKGALNRPWLGGALTQAEVRAVDTGKGAALDGAFTLATRIGPVLGEGTKGNPRQIKRFLNALLVRQAIAKARGFEGDINQTALAKLMLAERFQPDFYDHLAAKAMIAEDGKVSDLQALEAAQREDAKEPAGKTRGRSKAEGVGEELEAEVAKWLERDWLKRWLRMEPALGQLDLRPYIFVARDKRMLGGAVEVGGLDGLIDKLLGSGMALRMIEPEVKTLPSGDAATVFGALRERVLQAGNFAGKPPGFDGMGIIAKHHPAFQSELVAMVSTLDARTLGVWIVPGWNEILTEQAAKDQLRAVLTTWANQNDNGLLKRTAGQAIGAVGVRR